MKTRRFTIVELLVVVAIISILAAAILPGLARSREKARFVRWEAYNASLNSDEDVVVNYNFQVKNYRTSVSNVGYQALRNGAAACNIGYYEATDYDGLLRNSMNFEWRQGRYLEKNALQFDGRTTYVETLGYPGIDFDPLGDSFTIMAWVNFDRVSLAGTVFGKGTLAETQYGVTRDGTSLKADVGEADSDGVYASLGLTPGKWYHLALRCTKGQYELFVNGRQAANSGGSQAGSTVSDFNLVLGASPYESTSGGGNGKGKGGGNGNAGGNGNGKGPGTPPGNAYGLGKGKKPKGKVVVSATNFFQGRMDELVVFKDAISDQAINDHYRMGLP